MFSTQSKSTILKEWMFFRAPIFTLFLSFTIWYVTKFIESGEIRLLAQALGTFIVSSLMLTRTSTSNFTNSSTSNLVVLVHVLLPIALPFFSFGEGYPTIGIVLVIIGASLSALGLVDLGRSFGVFPAARSLKTEGIYSFVRHPIYLGYNLGFAGWFIVFPNLGSALIFCIFICFSCLRIRFEELVLLKTIPEFSDYVKRVRYRLIPWVL